MLLPVEIIKKKRSGQELSENEIAQFISAYTSGQLPDYQMSALLMAIYFNGMTESETLTLTKCMLHSGVVVDLSNVIGFKVDKHSTGGVGDKTSLILGPIVAAAGLSVPMISGRGLGHTGGTLDKLESIPGFNTQLSLQDFATAVEKHKICFIGQTKEICPADKKIYALRDVTATIESLPLICASIMSKKLAEGIDGLVLDVKFGSGAFMKDTTSAEHLAKNLMSIARGYGKKVAALITNMNQPLGRFAGNSLEVEECVAIMKNEKHLLADGSDAYEDTRELSLQLSAYMLWLGGAATDIAKAYNLAEQTLQSGRALTKFYELCEIHGGNLGGLPRPQNKMDIVAEKSGWVGEMCTEAIGYACVKMKAGRAKTTDIIEPTAGVEFLVKIGSRVEKNQPLLSIFGADLELLTSVVQELKNAITVVDKPVEKTTLVHKVLI